MMILAFLLGLLTPVSAHAQLGSTITAVGGGLRTIFGGADYTGGFPGIAGAIVEVLWVIVIPVGTFIVVRAGMSLIVSQEEDKLSRAKRTITSTLIGIMLLFISQELVRAFFVETIVGGGEFRLASTVNGIINWFLVAIVAIGIFMIILSALRAMGSFGKEEGATNIRQTVFAVATGFIFISLVPIVKLTLGIANLEPAGINGQAPDASPLIATGAALVQNVILFLALLAVTIVIYAGIRMIVNLGNEEEFTKSRSLIVRALVGLLIVLLSYTMVTLIINFVVAPNV